MKLKEDKSRNQKYIPVGIRAVMVVVGLLIGILAYKIAFTNGHKNEAQAELAMNENVAAEQTVSQDDQEASEQENDQNAMKESIPSLEGTWNRTGVYQADAGSIDISKLTKEGFDFYIEVVHAANTGQAEGHASFESDSKAVGTVELQDGGKATFYFAIIDDKIEVTSENATYLGGMGTFFDGTYIKTDPVYLNANIVEKTLGTYLDQVKTLLGEDYEFLVTVMEGGIAYESDLTYSGFVEGAGMGADLKITEDGKIYCLIYDVEYRFYTNDPEYKNKVPAEFGELGDVGITYYYKELR